MFTHKLQLSRQHLPTFSINMCWNQILLQVWAIFCTHYVLLHLNIEVISLNVRIARKIVSCNMVLKYIIYTKIRWTSIYQFYKLIIIITGLDKIPTFAGSCTSALQNTCYMFLVKPGTDEQDFVSLFKQVHLSK